MDASVDSGVYVSATVEGEINSVKQQARSNIFRVDDPPNFQTGAANWQ